MPSYDNIDTFNNKALVQNINIIDVDAGFLKWWNDILSLSLKVKDGGKLKVPTVFVAPERWEIARKEGFRDKNGTLILPIIAISRTGMSVGNDTPTSRHFADTKQQVVYAYQIDPKSSLIKELVRKQRENADPHVKLDPSNPIYEIYTRKAPDHYSLTYEVKIWVPYIENMNEALQKIAQKFDFLSVKSFKFDVKDKYYLVAFQSDDIEDESNTDDYSGEERIIKKTLKFTVGADIHPENDDQKPNFRKYYSQSKLFFQTKVVEQIPIINPDELALHYNTINLPGEPVISGIASPSNRITIIAPTTGGRIDHYVRVRNGVVGGVISNNELFLAEDCCNNFTVRAVGPTGMLSQDSNSLGQTTAGPCDDSNYLSYQTPSSLDLGNNKTLIVVLDPVDASPQIPATGFTVLSCCPGLSANGWAMFITTNSFASGNAGQVGMFYSHATAPGYTWIQTLGNISRIPGQPVRIVFVDDGSFWRVSVNGSPVVSGSHSAGIYTNVNSSSFLRLGTFTGLPGFPDGRNKISSFAVLNRAISDAEAIQESGKNNSWAIQLSQDISCSVDAHATRDFFGGTNWSTSGSSPITLTKTGSVGSLSTLSGAYKTMILSRPDDTGLWNLDSACNTNFYRTTQQARWTIDTDSEDMVVQEVVDEASPYYTDICMRVSGGINPNPIINLGAYTTPYLLSGYFNFGSGGVTKTVELVSSVQSSINSLSIFKGGFPYQINIPSNRTATVRSAITPSRRLVVYGDSLVAERTFGPEIYGPFGLLRQEYPGQITIDAALNRALYEDLNGGIGQTALVNRLASECNGTNINEMWLMVGLEDHWRSLWSSLSSYTTAYNLFLSELRAALPNVHFYVQTRGVADSPYGDTGQATMAQWRTAQSGACVGISGITLVDGASLYSLSDLDSLDSATTPNRVHFTTSGAINYKNAIRTILGF